MASKKRKNYKQEIISITENNELDPFVLVVEIIKEFVKDKESYMVYENTNEISVAIGEYIGIEVYKDKMILLQDGVAEEHKVHNLSEDMKKVFNTIDFIDWRMYGMIDFNYAKHTFLKNVDHNDTLVKLFIPRTDIRILKDVLVVKTIDCIDEISSQLKRMILNSKVKKLDENISAMNLEKIKATDSEYYKDIVSKGIEEINNKKYDKVILSRKINLEKRISLTDSFLIGRKFNTPARSYCLNIGELEAVGFSPETVVEVDKGREVYTFPLAGTRAFTDDPVKNQKLKNELLKDPKEIAEHAVSVKLAFEELQQVCTKDSVSVIQFMEVLERGTVQHIASRLKGTLRNDLNEWHAVTALFPAVTASGIPKAECIEAIDRLEKDDRGLYSGGILTYDKDGTMDVALALRTAFQTDNETWVRVGAGIVKLSNAERELEETKEKIGSILNNLVYIEDNRCEKE